MVGYIVKNHENTTLLYVLRKMVYEHIRKFETRDKSMLQ